MTAGIRATAPGKLFVTGEYAVLDGGPAIGMAVEPRAAAALTGAADWSLVAPGWVDEPIPFDVDASDDGVPESPALTLVSAVLGAYKALDGRPEPQAVTLDTRAFYRGRRKLGLGSSAALIAALSTALASIGDVDAARLARAAQHRFQPTGSGADIAISLAGGVVHCRRTASRFVAERIAWPDGLHCIAIDSGRAASTPAMLARLSESRRRDKQLLAPLVDAAEHAAVSWSRANVDDALASLAAFAAALHALDRRAGIGVFSGGHEALYALGREHRVVYKPSGAGGGDLGLAFSDRSDRLERFGADAHAKGYERFGIRPASTGASIE